MAPKLYYFDAYAKGEAIRMAFILSGVEFEDHRITHAQVKEFSDEGKLEFNQVPMLELDDGTRMCQAAAILKYLNATLCKDGL